MYIKFDRLMPSPAIDVRIFQYKKFFFMISSLIYPLFPFGIVHWMRLSFDVRFQFLPLFGTLEFLSSFALHEAKMFKPKLYTYKKRIFYGLTTVTACTLHTAHCIYYRNVEIPLLLFSRTFPSLSQNFFKIHRIAYRIWKKWKKLTTEKKISQWMLNTERIKNMMESGKLHKKMIPYRKKKAMNRMLRIQRIWMEKRRENDFDYLKKME